MQIFRSRVLPQAGPYYQKHKNLFKGFGAGFFHKFSVAIMLALLPVVSSHLMGGEQMGGLFMAGLALLQVLFFSPWAGKIIDTEGTVKAFRIAFFIEILGALTWLITGHALGMILFFVSFYVGMAFFILDPFILERGKKSESGFLFGLKEEIYALAIFCGLWAVPMILPEPNWLLLPAISIGTGIISLWFLSQIPIKKNKIKVEATVANRPSPIKTMRAGLHFIKKNHKFPLFAVGSQLFEGLFVGAVWFLFPLHIFQIATGGDQTLTLGIYELMTIFLAAAAGFLSDRFNWRKLAVFAWSLMIICVWLIPFFNGYATLVYIGALIGLANNFFAAAGYHALANFDQDHAEDGQFSECTDILRNIGMIASPIVCGFLYQNYGFQIAMIYVAITVSFIGFWMIYLAKTVKADKSETATIRTQ